MVQKLGRPHNFRALSKPKQLTKHEHRHYWPYIPLLLLVVATVLISTVQPTRRGVLAYATNVSAAGLLESTNKQRAGANVSMLQLSQTLSVAAQAKAEDMVRRNYWSHNTPDGKEPWIFLHNAGYSYLRAGENLAYGFMTSDDTVIGWMNSKTHRENLLDSNFSEVGFGYANSSDFTGSGPETVVVAMYGKPQLLTASSTAPTTPVASEPRSAGALTTDNATLVEPATRQVARVQNLTGGQAPWTLFAVGVLTGIALAWLLIKHAAGFRHVIRDSERFILHHPLLDIALVSLVLAGSFLSQTTGFIK